MTAVRVGVRSGQALLVVLGAAALGLVLAAAIGVLGPVAALVPVAIVACCWLFWHPVTTLALLFATTVLIEGQPDVWPIALDGWYGSLGPTPLDYPDVLVVLLLGWVIHDRVTSRTPGPGFGPLALPMSLLAVALAFGLVTGYLGASNMVDLVGSARVVGLFLVLPPVTAAVLHRHERVRAAIGFAFVLVAARGAIALFAVLSGRTGEARYGGVAGAEASTFYEPTMNFLMVVVLLGITVALLRKVPVPRWVLVAGPILLVTVVLSYRRSFWIAVVLGLALVLVVATGRRGRPWLVLGAAAVALSLYLALSVGGTTDTTNPVLTRAESLSPSKLTQSSGDRYRLDEQRNVLAELRDHPFTGLGLGVPWAIRYPLSENHVGGQLYTHVTPLWYWLKLGPLGVAAYLWLWGTAVLTAYRVWRRGRDPRVRTAALALAAGYLGLMVAELTGPFTGIDVRITLVVAMTFGWLIAAWAGSSSEASAPESAQRTAGEPLTVR